MASLKDLPPRPRSTSTVPTYPRRVLLGALALAAGVAACTPASQAEVSGHLDESQAEREGTGGSTASSTQATTTQDNEPTGFGGQMAGGMPEPWSEGGGGTGGAPSTVVGEGGGAAPDPWGEGGAGGGEPTGEGGCAMPDPWGEGGAGGESFDGGMAESWGEGGAGEG